MRRDLSCGVGYPGNAETRAAAQPRVHHPGEWGAGLSVDSAAGRVPRCQARHSWLRRFGALRTAERAQGRAHRVCTSGRFPHPAVFVGARPGCRRAPRPRAAGGGPRDCLDGASPALTTRGEPVSLFAKALECIALRRAGQPRRPVPKTAAGSSAGHWCRLFPARPCAPQSHAPAGARPDGSGFGTGSRAQAGLPTPSRRKPYRLDRSRRPGKRPAAPRLRCG